ncbi:anti-sigma factor [Nocardia sp. NBC_01388]|uniref:anti-sigma factor n=1 Tax=Nocardia sp. NBC_01388 TaxID=2903596 RepID=UPI0032552D93
MDRGAAQPYSGPATIGLQVPALPEQLMMLRALAETVLHMADFGIGEVNDIRLALDEVATILIQDAIPGSILDCDLTYDQSGLGVRLAAVASSEAVLEDGSLSWHIVRTLTDGLSATQGSYSALVAGYPTVVEFRWRSRTSEGGQA